MTDEQIFKMAREAKFHSAMLLRIYGDKIDALCDSEIAEIESIKKFAKMIEDSVRAEADINLKGKK
jgi:hypothetical protein